MIPWFHCLCPRCLRWWCMWRQDREHQETCPMFCVTWWGRSWLGLGCLEGCSCGLCSLFSGCTLSPGPKAHGCPSALSSEKMDLHQPAHHGSSTMGLFRALQKQEKENLSSLKAFYPNTQHYSYTFHRTYETYPSCLLTVQIVHYLYIIHTCYLTYFSFF